MESTISDEEYIKIYNTIPTLETKCRQYNRALINRFPFLLPRNRWTGEVVEDYDYLHTELDMMPEVWRKAFGIQMCEEIEAELEKYNFQNNYRIMDIKEKYGSLHWYDGGVPADSKVHDIIHKYEELSTTICFSCGKPAEYETPGWIEYVCKDCFIEYYKDNHTSEELNLLLEKCSIKHGEEEELDGE